MARLGRAFTLLATEAMLSTTPLPARDHAGQESRMVRNIERTLRSKAKVKSSSVASSTVP